MITLGIHDGHTATACILRDGHILACISEERLNRIKEWGGFPNLAIKECFKIANITSGEIDGIGVAGLMPPTTPQNFYSPHWFKRLFGFGENFLPNSFLRSNKWTKLAINVSSNSRKKGQIKSELEKMGIKGKPYFYEHHLLHAITAYYFSPFRNRKCLVLTCDGSGDALCGSVNVGENGNLKRLKPISTYNSIGEFYTNITRYLGMKPMSHEYKVMGLAPYAKDDYSSKTHELIKNFFRFNEKDPMVFKNYSGVWKWKYQKKFRKIFENIRFDYIARAAQTLIENILVMWIKNCIRETGIKAVCLSGGVFMNVKANNLILNLPEVDNLFIFPSCGDESLAMGVTAAEAMRLGWKHFQSLKDLYFGPSFSEEFIKDILKNYKNKYKIEKIDNIEEYTAEQIAKGKIVARFSGRMEWGARALGNRSILADPRNKEIVIKINEAIKNRDFWMPFAPAILEERADEYLINPKKFFAPYMIMAFPTTKIGAKCFAASVHPYDLTARPQIIKEDWNPEFYSLIKSFEKNTGLGGLLNTSFNLHGEPIVCSPQDALYTFENSALDGLSLGPYYISK